MWMKHKSVIQSAFVQTAQMFGGPGDKFCILRKRVASWPLSEWLNDWQGQQEAKLPKIQTSLRYLTTHIKSQIIQCQITWNYINNYIRIIFGIFQNLSYPSTWYERRFGPPGRTSHYCADSTRLLIYFKFRSNHLNQYRKRKQWPHFSV
jgi:hypothetical protein